MMPILGLVMLLAAFEGLPGGVPVATFAIGEAGAKNAGLHAAAVLALGDAALAERLEAWRAELTNSVAETPTDAQ